MHRSLHLISPLIKSICSDVHRSLCGSRPVCLGSPQRHRDIKGGERSRFVPRVRYSTCDHLSCQVLNMSFVICPVSCFVLWIMCRVSVHHHKILIISYQCLSMDSIWILILCLFFTVVVFYWSYSCHSLILFLFFIAPVRFAHYRTTLWWRHRRCCSLFQGGMWEGNHIAVIDAAS